MDSQVVVFDGAMGTSLGAHDLSPADFDGHPGVFELLVLTRPELVRQVHADFFAAGSDVVLTNSFGTNGVVLADYGLAQRTYPLARRAAELAREVAAEFDTPARRRFVCGSVGPGTKLPTLGQISFSDLCAAFEPQIRGLIDGGADAIVIETCQDLLQIKAAVEAARRAHEAASVRLPVFVSVTIESGGTMLVGTDLEAVAAAVRPLGIELLGLNCATGPDTMKRHVRDLDRYGPARIATQPNAGLPQTEGGALIYPMGPAEFADWLAGFVRDEGVGVVGGCCGTTPDHIRALSAAVAGLVPARREIRFPAAAASTFHAVAMTQEPPPLLVGERMNARGSREFRACLDNDDIDGVVAIARAQEDSGAHLLDLSVAKVGGDEAALFRRLVPALARNARAPLVIDSTDPGAIDAALSCYGGRAVINSINLEAGRDRLDRIVELARRFGAALIALVIDEQGMADSAARKLEIAARIHDLVVVEHGLAPRDLIFDMLTFTVASGEATLADSARQTLAAIAEVKRKFPGVATILGVSNVSYGLSRPIRRALNSVFLALAVERGLDQAIVNPREIEPVGHLSPEVRALAERLLLADHRGGDPLQAFIAHFDSSREASRRTSAPSQTPEDRLAGLIRRGIAKGLAPLMESLLAAGREPLAIINEILLPAMQEVGDAFGRGETQLPFVLQSAEVMKRAVAHLEPLMDGGPDTSRATIVLSTVKGDVHDVGKNLVAMILKNNGYRIVDLGIKVALDEMLAAAREHEAHVIAMSGLLVSSTLVMRENLVEMRRRGVDLPVLLGGAALTRKFVETDLRECYGPNVHYAKDPFEALSVLLDEVLASSGGSGPARAPQQNRARRPAAGAERGEAEGAGDTGSFETITPPYLGARVLPEIPLAQVWPRLDEDALFRHRWGYKRGAKSADEYVTRTARPTLERLMARADAEGLFSPRAVVGYFPCHREGLEIVVSAGDDSPGFTADGSQRFAFPRLKAAPHRSLAERFAAGPMDPPAVVGMFVVTVGDAVVRVLGEYAEANRYRDYLHLAGLAAELADATAALVHEKMQHDIGAKADRYSFGYPACPDLGAQRGLFALLKPERIGVALTENHQMVPEHSVSAIVIARPEVENGSGVG